jgi:DNA-binding NtrC family response regulator
MRAAKFRDEVLPERNLTEPGTVHTIDVREVVRRRLEDGAFPFPPAGSWIELVNGGKVLVAEDEPSLREGLTKVLVKNGFDVSAASDGNEALAALERDNYDLVITDLFMPGADGMSILRRVRDIAPQTLVLLFTGHGSLETALEALRHGVVDYIQKPVPFAEVVKRVSSLLEWRDLSLESQALRRQTAPAADFTPFVVARSAAMRRITAVIAQVAPTNSTVLVTGESGVGKEVVARAVHAFSHAAERPFVPVNCAAIPDQLLENELFGHAKGAFTGADSAHEGLFHRARGGTIFLDEIGDMPAQLQAKLLRAIEEKEILPIGTSTPISVKVRVVASTNRDLKTAVEEGKFREDLYYRLKVVHIQVPPLRDRREDIPPLVEYLVQRHNVQLRRGYKGLDNQTMKLVMTLPWRGNVRELSHAIEYAMIVGDGEWVHPRDLPPGTAPDPADVRSESGETLGGAVRHFEKAFIENVLARNDGDRRKAADELGIDLSTLYRKIRDLQVE